MSASCAAHLLDVGERGAPVHLGLAGAEGVQVGAVEHGDRRHWHLSLSDVGYGLVGHAKRPVDGGRPAVHARASQVLSGRLRPARPPRSCGCGRTPPWAPAPRPLLPRSFRWTRKVSRAVKAAIAAMMANAEGDAADRPDHVHLDGVGQLPGRSRRTAGRRPAGTSCRFTQRTRGVGPTRAA